MKFQFGQSGDGEGFHAPDELFPSSKLVDFVLAYGEDGLEALEANPDEQVQALIQELIDSGMLERDEGGNLKLTPRMTKGMQNRALLEIFKDMKAGVRDGHQTLSPGRGGERTDGTKGYAFGDPLTDLAMTETLRNAMARGVGEDGIELRESDFELYNVESTADCATVVLLDLSGSMMRYGRHVAAKRVALGLKGLITQKFPLDSVDFVGFASTAAVIPERELPLIMPRPVTTRAWEVKVRVPLDQAEKTHPHFTNLQHGLQVARSVLSRRGKSNQQIFIVTDGEPTAHLTRAKEGIGQTLNLIYPPDAASSQAALEEAVRCQQAGIRMSTFALIEEYHTMDWVGFVEQFTRLVRGVAYYCTAQDVGSTIMESYLSGKKKRQGLG